MKLQLDNMQNTEDKKKSSKPVAIIKPIIRNTYPCEPCKLQFGSRKVYDMHLKIVHSVRPKMMTKRGTNRQKPYTPIKPVAIIKPIIRTKYPCKPCKLQFGSRRVYDMHLKAVHSVPEVHHTMGTIEVIPVLENENPQSDDN